MKKALLAEKLPWQSKSFFQLEEAVKLPQYNFFSSAKQFFSEPQV